MHNRAHMSRCSVSAQSCVHVLSFKAIIPYCSAPGTASGAGFQEWVLWGPSHRQVWGKRPDDNSEHSREWGKPLQGNVQYARHTEATSISKYSSSLEQFGWVALYERTVLKQADSLDVIFVALENAAMASLRLLAPRWLQWGISALEVRKLPFLGQRRGFFLEINGEGFERTQIILQCFGSVHYEHGMPVMLRTRE